jgi:hypothetical protein
MATSVGAAASFGAERRAVVGEERPVAPLEITESQQTPYVLPNHFELAGDDLHVTYAVIGNDQLVIYRDASNGHIFFGDEVHSLVTDAGTMVSVQLADNDMGITHLNLIIPSIAVGVRESVPVEMVMVTTLHVSPKWATGAGQHGYSSAIILKGTAADSF